MKILETERLVVREMDASDSEFILDLLNQPSFIKYIGDRNVRTVDEARDFIENRYRESYRVNGYGLYTVELKPEVESTLADARVSAIETTLADAHVSASETTLADAHVSANETTLADVHVSANETTLANAHLSAAENALADGKVSAVELKTQNSEFKTRLGICGFVKRDTLPDADIGFAFLPQFEKQGFAFESANALMKYGREVLGLKRVLAITTQNNESSRKLLEKIGFKFEKLVKMPHDEDELRLFSYDSQ